jgi:hypothetical protein
MQILLWILMALLGIDVLLIAAYVGSALLLNSRTFSLVELGPMLVGAGVLVALISLALTARRNASEDFLESSGQLLERAYTTLAQLDDQGRPQSNRMNWLAAARFLRAAENLGAQITEDSHKVVFREQLEYWRAKLYELIYPSSAGFPMDYFAEKPEHMLAYTDRDRTPLSIKSLAVLYRFVRWPVGFEDPIKAEPGFTEEEIERMRAFGPRGLGELLARVNDLKNSQGRK